MEIDGRVADCMLMAMPYFVVKIMKNRVDFDDEIFRNLSLLC
jgi:hypothetical protein